MKIQLFLTTTLTTLSVANTFVNADFIYTVVCSVLVFCFFNFCKRAKYSPPDASWEYRTTASQTSYQIMANELKIPHVIVSLTYMAVQAIIIVGYLD